MRVVALALFFAPFATCSAPVQEYLFSNPPLDTTAVYKIPTVRESALQARRILHLQNIATFSTIFPSPKTLEERPGDVGNAPIGLMEYYALCGAQPFNPSILGVTIATTMKNAAAGSNVTLSLRYHLPSDPPPPPDPWAYLPANLPRFSLVGYIERLPEENSTDTRDCFLKTHPDAVIWAPGADIHDSWWGRLVVEEVYFFGGFGDRARIGWIPLEIWQNITQEEIDEYRMVGEDGYKPRAVGDGLWHVEKQAEL